MQLPKDNEILLVGGSSIAEDYLAVLIALKIKPIVVCRTEKSAKRFKKATNYNIYSGGLERIIENQIFSGTTAIVAVNIDNLSKVTKKVILSGYKKILVEKPAGISSEEILDIKELAKIHKSKVLIAYNRRFYESARKAKEIILNDGGIRSFRFEFTEWSHVIQNLNSSQIIKERWFLSNSSHVVDLAFFLGGQPKEISSYISGQGELEWHPSSSVFSGSGKTISNKPFSYHADWNGPGRWGVELVTANHRLILSPMEKLQVQKTGSIDIDFVDLDDNFDRSFKPGFYKQLEAFVSNQFDDFCTIEEQNQALKHYKKISGYKL